MNFIRQNLVLAIAGLLLFPLSTRAGDVHFGVKGGLTFGELHWDGKDTFKNYSKKDQRLGFNAGLTIQYIGNSGFGFDLSTMYARNEYGYWDYDRISYNMFEVPLHVTFHLPLGIRSKFSPYIYTGPDLMVSLEDAASLRCDDYYYRDTRAIFSWNVGAGIMLFNHLQLQGGYQFGITNNFERDHSTAYGKGRVWQVSAAVVF